MIVFSAWRPGRAVLPGWPGSPAAGRLPGGPAIAGPGSVSGGRGFSLRQWLYWTWPRCPTRLFPVRQQVKDCGRPASEECYYRATAVGRTLPAGC